MSTITIEPNRSSGLARLHRFLPNAGALYTKSRNFDFGPERRSNVSMLSPFIRNRLILEQEVLEATLRDHTAAAASKFIQEVFWRAYFKGWMEQHPSVWAEYRRSVARLLQTLGNDAGALQRYEDAVTGNTGIDCFDAWVAELLEYGYLHNHSRMWFASIWVFTLRLPWQLGADFFYRNLVDGDAASNTLSWRWVSGLHTPGKTYLAEPSNIAYFTDNRFRPHGKLATRIPPLPEPDVYPIEAIRPSQVLEPKQRFGLLITEEDCSSESLFAGHKPVAILGATASQWRSQLPIGAPAEAFATGAVTDAVTRAAQTFGVSGNLTNPTDWGDTMVDWARQHDVDTIATAYAAVGPVAERLMAAAERLNENGIRLLQVRRSYDSIVWPHTRNGFYKLNDSIPALLQRLGVFWEEPEAEQQTG